MNLNNYLDCFSVSAHEINIDSHIYTTLFDQYNSLGFNWSPSSQFSPHYYQRESKIKELQEILSSSLKGRYKNFIFDTSGSMAIEHAIHYSRLATKKDKILAFNGCYHGSTLTIQDIEQISMLSIPFDESNHILIQHKSSFEQSIQEIEEKLSSNQYCCVLIDPNFCDYYISPPDWYYIQLRELCNKYNTFIIFDEMRTGFRSEQIWATNKIPIEIDMVVGAKALCNGLPFSLLALHEQIVNPIFLQKVEEACTGFAYNPFVLDCVIEISKQLDVLIKKETSIFRVLKLFSEKKEISPFYSIKSKGGYLIVEFKCHRAVFAASFCEAKLKKMDIIIYRSENRLILCPHYTFNPMKLEKLLDILVELANEAVLKLTPSSVTA